MAAVAPATLCPSFLSLSRRGSARTLAVSRRVFSLSAARRKPSDVRARRLSIAFLIPAGALVGHAAGYAMGGGHGHATPAHGDLTAAVGLAVPLGLAALAWHVWQGARGEAAPSLRLLLAAQPVVFLVQEVLEFTLGGHGMASLAQSPAVRAGVAAQVVVAVLIMLLVRVARAAGQAVVAALQRHRPVTGAAKSPPRPPTVMARRLRGVGTPIHPRGPPDLLVAT